MPLGLKVPADLGEVERVGRTRFTLGLLDLDVTLGADAPPVPARAADFVFVAHGVVASSIRPRRRQLRGESDSALEHIESDRYAARRCIVLVVEVHRLPASVAAFAEQLDVPIRIRPAHYNGNDVVELQSPLGSTPDAATLVASPHRGFYGIWYWLTLPALRGYHSGLCHKRCLSALPEQISRAGHPCAATCAIRHLSNSDNRSTTTHLPIGSNPIEGAVALIP